MKHVSFGFGLFLLLPLVLAVVSWSQVYRLSLPQEPTDLRGLALFKGIVHQTKVSKGYLVMKVRGEEGSKVFSVPRRAPFDELVQLKGKREVAAFFSDAKPFVLQTYDPLNGTIWALDHAGRRLFDPKTIREARIQSLRVWGFLAGVFSLMVVFSGIYYGRFPAKVARG